MIIFDFSKILAFLLSNDKGWRNFYVHAALKNMCKDEIYTSEYHRKIEKNK